MFFSCHIRFYQMIAEINKNLNTAAYTALTAINKQKQLTTTQLQSSIKAQVWQHPKG